MDRRWEHRWEIVTFLEVFKRELAVASGVFPCPRGEMAEGPHATGALKLNDELKEDKLLVGEMWCFLKATHELSRNK
jgi:hypothetical protein